MKKKSPTPATETPISPQQAAARIIHELRDMADPTKAASTQRYFAHPVKALGIDTPTMRDFTRSWIQRVKPQWKLSDARQLCDLLLREPHLETRGAGILVLAGFPREFDPELFLQAALWLNRYLDNWALVDSFSMEILSPLVRTYPELTGELRIWTESKCMWVRRASVVTLVPFARRGEQLDLVYELAEVLFGEKEDLMHKAVGWLLREAGKTDSQRLRKFLLRHGGAIPRTTVRYAIERFPAEERKQLLVQTR